MGQFPKVTNQRGRKKQRKRENKIKKKMILIKFLLKGFFQPQLRALHKLRAQSKHQDTELQLVECTITIKVTLHEHRSKILIGETLKSHKRRIPLEAFKSDDPFLRILQEVEPIAELVYEAITPKLVGHERKGIVEILGLWVL